MSDVYEAKHEFTKRPVALKLISASAAQDDDTAKRLRREGRAASAMGDPNIVDITDFGVDDDGSVYMVMEWLDGKTVRELLEEGPIATDVALDLASQTASGLASAHSIGVVHRDVKPENLMVVAGKDGSRLLKILDFGIAKVAGRELEKLTRTGTIVGTPAYMSPEQARGDAVDARSDVYSLGCVIYELFTGMPPFSSASAMEVVLMHVSTEATVPSALVPARQIPPAVDAVIMRCLAKEPSERFPSMMALRAELQSLAKGEGTLAPQTLGAGEELDLAKTMHYKAQRPDVATSPPVAQRAMPEPAKGASRARWPIVVAVLGLVAGAVAIAFIPFQSDKELVADYKERVAEDDVFDAGQLANRVTKVALDSGAASADARVVHVAVPAVDAGVAAPTNSELWTYTRSHSKFSVVLSAESLLSPRAPIDLHFKLKDLKDRVSWSVTEGRLQARIEFVHFVRHDTMGRVTAKVDDQGAFRAILSVPQTGKYHLKIRLSDGSKVVGRSQIDICVGAVPGTAKADSLCPKLGELSGKHGAAR
tara:strand:+ start:86069 stop:87679 length:1611 start_codon:yes stop_codon:yes gene_type:complete